MNEFRQQLLTRRVNKLLTRVKVDKCESQFDERAPISVCRKISKSPQNVRILDDSEAK